jgi:hypothetical protein
MTDERSDSGAGRSDRDGSVDPLRPVVRHGWSGLLGGDGGIESRPEHRLGPGVLAPFSGVLGPWVPSVEGVPLRLSFLSLPWLVHRAVRTTERVDSTDRPAERSGDPRTPETTTVSRLLRAGGPVKIARSNTDTVLREVLRWRPGSVDFSPVSGGTATSRAGRSRTARAALPAVPRTLWSNRGAVVTGDRETASDDDDGGVHHGTDRRESRTAPTSEGPSSVGSEPSPEASTGTGPVWSVGERRSPGLSPSTDRFRPMHAAVAARESGRRARAGEGEGLPPGERTDTARPVSPGNRPRRSWGDGREPSPVTGGDRTSFPGPLVAPRSGVGRVAEAVAGASTPHPPAGETDRAGVGMSSPLVYRQGGATSEPVDGRVGPAWATQERPSVRPGGVPVGDTSTADAPNGSVEGTPPGRWVAEEGAYGGRDASGADRTRDTPVSPFASFPDADAVVDHLYYELERRQRIERERRGL